MHTPLSSRKMTERGPGRDGNSRSSDGRILRHRETESGGRFQIRRHQLSPMRA
jgi:hypothetical protein